MKIFLTLLSFVSCQLLFGQNIDSLLNNLELSQKSEVSKDTEYLANVHGRRKDHNVDSLLLVIESTEISELSKNIEHQKYFFNMFKIDEGIREKEVQIHSKFGFKSKQHDSIIDRKLDIERYLFSRVVTYLEMYPHPTIEKGSISCTTPCTIFNHSVGTPSKIEKKKKYFSQFYKTYQLGDLYSGLMWTYLFRLHEQILGTTYTDRELGEAEQIEDMIDILELKRK